MSAVRAAGRLARVIYVVLACATIVLGLLVHGGWLPLGAVSRDVMGDLLWATMMFWWVGAVAPSVALMTRAAAALAICVAVEFSQLVHNPMLDVLRATVVGRLVLGSGFDPRDLLAYTLGVVAGVLFERAVGTRLLAARRTPSPK